MKIKAVLFDLDGTLTDPKEGITKSFCYALSQMGISETPENLLKVIGPPLADSFEQFYGLHGEECDLAIAKYREYFAEVGIFENRLYDGVGNMLATLKGAGLKVLIASSKPQVFVERILEHYGVINYFDFIVGAHLDGRRSKKSEVITFAIENSGCDKDQIIMVGDRIFDIDGAREVGVRSVGVTWGYSQEGEFDRADFVCDSIDQLKELLVGLC